MAQNDSIVVGIEQFARLYEKHETAKIWISYCFEIQINCAHFLS